jgi:hypothetical protein
MIEMMEPSKRLVAKDTLLPLVPVRNNIPNQAVLRIGLNLLQTLLAAITALRPTRALIQAKDWFTNEGPGGGFPRCHIHCFFRERLRAGYESLAPEREIGLHGRYDTGESQASHHSQDSDGEKS